MANRFLSNIRVNDAYTLPASDGSSGQVITTDGAGNLGFSTISIDTGSTVIYQDNFTGDNSTTTFTLAHTVNDEVITQVYIDGVYQSKLTYSTSGDQLIFTEAPFTGASIEVISMNSVSYGGFQFDITSPANGDLLIYNTSTGLWENGTTVQTIQFDGGTSSTAGTLSWNVADGTLDLEQEGTTLQLGQEQHYHVKNSSGASIPDGTAVMATGTDGVSGHILIAPMVADGTVSPKYYLGVTTQTIGNGEFGKVTSFGKVNAIDTSAFTQGAVLWVDPATPGGFTATKPSSPNLKIATAFVVAAHAVNGKIFVRANAGIDLHENHRVQIQNPDAYGNPQVDGTLLVWDNTNTYWTNSNTVSSLTSTGTITAPVVQTSVIYDSAGNSAIYPDSNGSTIASNLTVFGSVKVEDDTATASASNVGSLRYREDVNGSYVDMCMKTSSTPTYAWVNIVQNTF